jgi:DNA replication and repair protein RecF
VALISLSTRGFRNLRDGVHEIPPGFVVILGANGAGKTNFLEAIAVLGNVTSFRLGGTRAWVRRGGREYELLGLISHGERDHEIRQHVQVGTTVTRSFFRNSRTVDTATYLDLFPVFTFSGEDRQLLLGPPALRRRFVDRLAFHSFPETLGIMHRAGKRRAT